VCILVVPTWGADWPQWRGPNRDGRSPEKGLLKDWTNTKPPLAWQAEGLGSGYSGVAVAGDRIYTMGNHDGKAFMIALQKSTGDRIWETPVSENENDPNCTPTVDGDLVFGVTFRGELVCCSTNDGKVIWQKNFEKDFGGQMMSGWGYSESPLVDGNRLICTPGAHDAMLAALDKKSGEVIWKTVVDRNLGSSGGDGAAYSSIMKSSGGGVDQYVQLVGRGVIGVSAKDGKLLWNYNRIANGTANIPTPIVNGNYVFASTGYGDGGTALLELKPAGRGQVNANEVYYFSSSEVQNHHGGMILVGDYVYMGHGHGSGLPLCLEFKTGREMWKERGPGANSAAIAYADGNLYFRYEDGTMALIEANPKEYKLKGTFKLASVRGSSWAHPAIADGKLYLRDQDVLMCYDVKQK